MFPPQTGLSYSTWISVDKFSDPRTDPHCVRLLTLVRNIHGGRDDHLVCLAVVMSARDKAVIVTTQETVMPPSEFFFWILVLLASNVRLTLSEQMQECNWAFAVLGQKMPVLCL